MKIRTILLVFLTCGIVGCGTETVIPDHESSSSEIIELNAFRNSASARCSGASYKYALGSGTSLSASASANISKKLLEKGYGDGSLDVGITLNKKTGLSSLLGNLSNEQVENFLKKYQDCMNSEMESFYLVKGIKRFEGNVEYSSKSKTFGDSKKAIRFEGKAIALTTTDYNGIQPKREHFEKKAADIFCTKMDYNESDGYVIYIDSIQKKYIPTWRFNLDGSKKSRPDYAYFTQITCSK